jgi:hypothetical protein
MEKQIFFHHYQKITKTQLKEAVKSYHDGLDPKETKSCIILWSELEHLANEYKKMKNPMQGFRIYFFRADPFKQYSDPNQKILKVGDKTQMSIIFVPINKYEYEFLSPPYAEDMFGENENDECSVLIPGGEHTGLCPNNCGGSI